MTDVSVQCHVLLPRSLVSAINNFFTCPEYLEHGAIELSGKPLGLIVGNAGMGSFHGLVKMSWSLRATVYRSSAVVVVDFDVPHLLH